MPNPSLACWIWIGCAGLLTVVGYLSTGLAVTLDRAFTAVGLLWLLSLFGLARSVRRPTNRSLAPPFEIVAQLIAISTISVFLQYLAARTDRPLIDSSLALADRAISFDWPASFAWVLKHPVVENSLSIVYLSFGMQSFMVAAVAWRYPERARICLSANALSLSVCLAIFAVWPAAGPFSYYAPAGIISDYIPQLAAARSNAHLALALGNMRGLISFPSYHAAVAALLVYAFAVLPKWVAIPAITLEIILAISAVLVGGHYLIDVLFGVLVAMASIATACVYAKRGSRAQGNLNPAVVRIAPAKATRADP